MSWGVNWDEYILDKCKTFMELLWKSSAMNYFCVFDYNEAPSDVDKAQDGCTYPV